MRILTIIVVLMLTPCALAIACDDDDVPGTEPSSGSPTPVPAGAPATPGGPPPTPITPAREGITIVFSRFECRGDGSYADYDVLSPGSDLVTVEHTVQLPGRQPEIARRPVPLNTQQLGRTVVPISGEGETTLLVRATNADGQSAEESRSFTC